MGMPEIDSEPPPQAVRSGTPRARPTVSGALVVHRPALSLSARTDAVTANGQWRTRKTFPRCLRGVRVTWIARWELILRAS
jgi:hypothetical protein